MLHLLYVLYGFVLLAGITMCTSTLRTRAFVVCAVWLCIADRYGITMSMCACCMRTLHECIVLQDDDAKLSSSLCSDRNSCVRLQESLFCVVAAFGVYLY